MEYTITKTIRPGMTVRINGSHAYEGITNGVVVIDAIKHMHEVPREFTVSYLEAAIQSYDNNNSWDINQIVVDEIHSLGAKPWVGYTYLKNEEEGQLWLPVDIFLDHISGL